MQDESKRRLLIVGLLLGMFFSSLDQTIVGTAMPRIIGELGGLALLTWVTIGYMLSSTTVVPIAGKLADLFGRRTVYLTGMGIFLAGSALCGTAQDMTQLILFRALQGLGGGMLMPMSMTIVGDIFPPEQRGKWQGLMGAVFGLSSIVGPTIGGWIVDHSHWRWIFYINIPVGVVAALTIWNGLGSEKKRAGKADIDWAGVVTLVVGAVSLLLGLSLGGKEWAWGAWQTFALFGTAAIFITLFIFAERRAKDPLLNFDFFKNRTFLVANLVGFIQGFGMFGAIMFLPLFLQGVVGVSATNSGNTMIPMMAALMATSIIGGRFITKVTFRTFYMTGLALMAFGFWMMSSVSVDTTQFQAIIDIIVLGLGLGLLMPSTTLAVQTAFPPEKRGVVTAATQFFRQIGSTLGMAILGVVLNNRSLHYLNERFFPSLDANPALKAGPFGPLLEKAHQDPQGLFNVLLAPKALEAIPAPYRKLLTEPLKLALVDSLKYVFLAAMSILLVGVVVAVFSGKARVPPMAVKKASLEEMGKELLAEDANCDGVPASVEPDLLRAEAAK